VRRFLNRILGLPVHRQNLLFNYFGAILQAELRQAKAEGRFSEGMSDLPAAQISFACEPEARAHLAPQRGSDLAGCLQVVVECTAHCLNGMHMLHDRPRVFHD
jgi:C-terminal domain on Strawberry notch homologue